MASTTLTVSQAVCHIPELWSPETRDAVEANIVAAALVDRTYTQELVGGPGDTMNIPYISNPTAGTKSGNTNVDLEAFGPGSAEASIAFTINTHDYVAFGVENITEVQSKTNLRAKYTGKAGYGLAAAADTLLHALVNTFTQQVGVLGIEPTEDNWLRGSQYLDDANAPESGRFIIVRPATYYAMQKIDRFVNADYVGSASAESAIRRNFIGTLLNAPVYKTTLVTAQTTDQADNWFCHTLGVYFCSQDLRTRADFVIERDTDVVLSTHIYGYKEALQPPITAGGGAATDVFNVAILGVS